MTTTEQQQTRIKGMRITILLVAAGMNPMDLRRGIQLGVDAILKEFTSVTKSITTSQMKSRRSGEFLSLFLLVDRF